MPDHASKQCSKCGGVKPLEQFPADSSKPDGHRGECQECRAAAGRKYYQANREAKLAWQRQHWEARGEEMIRRRHLRIDGNRDAVFAHYGAACACCGATDDLTIDHKAGDGAQHRQELFGDSQRCGADRFYVWLIRQGFPAAYQTLCRACNISKGRGGRCRLSHEMAVGSA